jgi:hypothetical protein
MLPGTNGFANIMNQDKRIAARNVYEVTMDVKVSISV